MRLEVPLKRIAVVGAGGFGREVAWLIREINELESSAWDMVGFIDEDSALRNRIINGHPVLGGLETLEGMPGISLALALGSPSDRMGVVDRISKCDVRYPNLIHPSATIGQENSLGFGNILCAGVILTVNIRVGNFCHLNLKTSLGHDCVLEDFATTACGVDFAGFSHIGQGCYFGNHATVLPSVRVGAWAVIGAGAVVNRDVEAGSVCVGVPARPIKMNSALRKTKKQA
ncbi:MAG: acetyltransferase [Deltaproteobacteria bacterium]|nr:acetyltransferase [Deltaproteobacteria bacterium]